jgi:hypothetical protein
MDAGIADTLNRQIAQRIAKHLDLTDWFCMSTPGALDNFTPWHLSNMAATFMSENRTTNADRAWLLGALAVKTPDVDFESIPADCDWENLFSHLRAEITTRRDPETLRCEATEDRHAGVV